MDQQSAVLFRNVGQVYFPQTRVECHYSLTSEHRWNNRDWIGIFAMGWSSVKEYYTYTWALVPEGYTDPSSVNCCALFHARYLPPPGAAQYQFVYVDSAGQACARSRTFAFAAPKPLEELETLREEQDEEDGDEELVLVVPRAQLLQGRLEESLKAQADLRTALETSKREAEEERERSWRLKEEWWGQREAMTEEISELREKLRHDGEAMRTMEEKHMDARYGKEDLTRELSRLTMDKAEREQRVTELEREVRVLTERTEEGNVELKRLKEKLKVKTMEAKHSEEKRRFLQVETEAGAAEARGLKDRVDMSEHVAECLRRELRELGTRQAHTHTELQQARLQVAQLSLQLSEENLLLREEQANWALEREAHKHAAETANGKLLELSGQLDRMEREKRRAELDRDRNEKLLSYVQQLEQRLGIVPETESGSEVAALPSADSPSDDEDDARSASRRSARSPFFSDQSSDNTETDDARNKLMQEELGADGWKLIDPILSELADSPSW